MLPSPNGARRLGKGGLPALQPLGKGGDAGKTPWGDFSRAAAERAMARTMLKDDPMQEMKHSDSLSPTRGFGRGGNSPSRLQNLSRTTSVSAPAMPGGGGGGGSSLFARPGGNENLWGSGGGSKMGGRGGNKLGSLSPVKSKPRKLKSIAKKRERRRKKKMAARHIQKAWRGHKKRNRGVMLLQSVIRGFVARRHVKRMKQAKEAGVMVAMKGTTQGKSGWYQDFDGQTYFFAVDTKGVWWQVMKPEQWQARSDELENVPVLVVAEGQKLGEPGKYREFGIKGVKKKPQKWKVNDVGIWNRAKDRW